MNGCEFYSERLNYLMSCAFSSRLYFKDIPPTQDWHRADRRKNDREDFRRGALALHAGGVWSPYRARSSRGSENDWGPKIEIHPRTQTSTHSGERTAAHLLGMP